MSEVRLQEAGSQISGGKATGGVGKRFPFHFPEAAKLEVESCLIPEAARDGGILRNPKGSSSELSP